MFITRKIYNRIGNTGVFKRNFFTIIHEWEKGIQLNFGKYNATIDPGIRLNIPLYHEIHKINMSDKVKYMNQQSLISKDNVTFYIDSSIEYKVVNAKKSILNVIDLDRTLLEKAQMALRKTLSGLEMNEILHDMDDTTQKIKNSMADLEDKWGIEINDIQITDIKFDDSMKRAMAVKAEADRNAQAKVINARADIETAELYSKAAEIYAENPLTMRLREFQLWNSVSKNPNNTIYVVPSNMLDFVKSVDNTVNNK